LYGSATFGANALVQVIIKVLSNATERLLALLKTANEQSAFERANNQLGQL